MVAGQRQRRYAQAAMESSRRVAMATMDTRLNPAFALAESLDNIIQELATTHLLPESAYALTSI